MSEKQALKIEVEPTGEFLEVLRKARNALEIGRAPCRERVFVGV